MATGATAPGGRFVAGNPDLLTDYGSAYSYKDETLVGPVVRPRRVLRDSRNSGYPRAAPTPSASRHAIRRRRTGWTGSACMRPPVPNRDRPSRPSRMMRIGTSVARRTLTNTRIIRPTPGRGATDQPVDRDRGVRDWTPERSQLSHLRPLNPSRVSSSRSIMCDSDSIYTWEMGLGWTFQSGEQSAR